MEPFVVKRRWFAISIVVLAIIVTLAFLEILVRIVDPFQFLPKRDASIFAPQTYRLSKNKNIRYELIPDSRAEFAGIDFQVNSAGFRDKPYRVHKGNKKRIIFVGDSLTYGWLIPLADTYHKQLEKILHDRGYAVETMGMGVVGYNLVQEYSLVKERVAGFDPDLLVLQIGPNDFEKTVSVKKTDQGKLLLTPYNDFQIPYMFPKNGFSRFLMSSSHLFKFINLKLYGFRKKREENFSPKDIFQMGAEEGFRYLDRIIDFSRNAKIPLAVVVFPFRHGSDHYVYAALHEDIKGRLRGMKIPFLDLDEHFNSVRDRNIWVDGLHPNRDGMKIVALELADFIPPLLDKK
jgi:lysophospholipase L1-like esterase